jgi:N-acetylglucosaminyldiphosphoundecaprenol N-acetyl-beta-D-mannosaminyltransferase
VAQVAENSKSIESSLPAVARANVLGVGISVINMEDAVRLSDLLLQSKQQGYICVTGVHGIVEAQSDSQFRRILNSSFFTTPDGMPTVWVARLQGHRSMRRVYGPDFMIELCRLSVERGYKQFLYGGKEGIAERLAVTLAELVPGVEIVGTFTPPFRPLRAEEEAELIARVKKAQPDIVWVGLSTPKQERFMAEYMSRLDATLMVGVGAGFDIHTGAIRDAPRWMKSAGLQWFHRLIQEPRRLWKRYLINNPRFAWNVTLQLLGIRKFTLEP